MTKIQIPMTAQLPSGFAMPTSAPTAALCGTGLGAGAGMATVAGRTAPVYVTRERVVTGDAIQPFPGPTAWSPPTS
ncbi:hypothetical protein [Nocardioides sp. GXQ0305]|uniref:hypothetical protein n=1 Tax=Nocardioides sp. GXQ0305 TaxID=3423912 RepID=UPI003D7CCC09